MVKKILLFVTDNDGSTTEVPLFIQAGDPAPLAKSYAMLNCVNWAPTALKTLPLQAATELTYFVLPVTAQGALTGGSLSLESAFVKLAHDAGKTATFSIAGGSQNVSDITKAVTQKTNLITAIVNRVAQFGYDGVTLDIENTNLQTEALALFVNDLRRALGTSKVIGMYSQPYQLHTVFSKLETFVDSLSWISPMCYDFPNTVEDIKTITTQWIEKAGKDKVLLGLAVNYDDTGVNITEFESILAWGKEKGLKGVGIWNNILYTKEYQDKLQEIFPTH